MEHSSRSLSSFTRAALCLLTLGCVMQGSPVAAMPMPGDAPAAEAMVSDSTGTATVTIPIDLPPGTGGFTPEMALVYSSDAGNGFLGQGWRIQLAKYGLGDIRISTRFGFPRTTAEEQYELNGEMLIASASESNRYHTQVERFLRIRRLENGARWSVEHPDGSKAFYGESENSRIRGPGNRTFTWQLERIVSAAGNTIRIEYLRSDTDPGIAYPSRILYSLRNGQPVGDPREVRFIWENRPDEMIDFMGFTKRVIGLRLKEVRVTVGGRPFQRRVLGYLNDSSVSTMVRTQLFGSDCPVSVSNPGQSCQGLPAQTFAYSTSEPAPGTSTYWSTGPENLAPVPLTISRATEFAATTETGVRFEDLTGDGKPEMVQAYREANGTNVHRVFRNNGNGWDTNPEPTLTASLASIRARMYHQEAIGLNAATGCATSYRVFDAGAQPILFTDRSFGEIRALKGYSWYLRDLNGDGYADIFTSYVQGTNNPGCPSTGPGRAVIEIWLFDPANARWVRDPRSDQPGSLPAFNQNGDRRPQFEDFDGDGLIDIAVTEPYEKGQTVQLGYGGFFKWRTRFFSNPYSEQPSRELPAPPPLPDGRLFSHFRGGETGVRFVDLNRDGATDIVQSVVEFTGVNEFGFPSGTALRSHVWLSQRGNGFCASYAACPEALRYASPRPLAGPSLVGTDQIVMAPTGMQFVDLNGDGWTDVVDIPVRVTEEILNEGAIAFIHDPRSDGIDGTVWKKDARYTAPFANVGEIQFSLVDANGDGRTDAVRHQLKTTANNSGLTTTVTKQSYLGQSRLPGLMTRFANGNGGRVEFEYQPYPRQSVPLVEFSAALEVLDGQEQNPGLVRGDTRPVVTKVRRTGGFAEPVEEQFIYARPAFDPVRRNSLGFGAVIKTLPDGTQNTRIFNQQPGRAGMLRKAQVRAPEGNFVQQMEMQIDIVPSNFPGTTPGAIVSRPVSMTMKTFGDEVSVASTQTMTLQYADGYGYNFVSEMRTERPTGTLVQKMTPRTADTFRWIVGLPATMEARDASGKGLSRMEMSYTVLGQVETMTALDGARGSLASATRRTTEMAYDAFGNMRAVIDPAGRPTFMCYDGDADLGTTSCPSPAGQSAHAVVVGMLDPADGLTEIEPDPTTGLVERMTRFNGDVMRQVYDAFGRSVQSFLDPVGATPETLVSRTVHHDGPTPEAGFPYTETFMQVGDGSEIRMAMYRDGLGVPFRMVRPTENGFVGSLTIAKPSTREMIETLDLACGSDSHCRNLTPTVAGPRSIMRLDAAGRVVEMQTPEGVEVFRHTVESRLHPETGARPLLDTVLAKDPNGNLERRYLDGDRVVFVDECQNQVPAGARDLSGVACSDPDTTFFSYEPTGELGTVFDALAMRNPGGFASNPEQRYRTIYDSLGRVVRREDPDAGTSLLTYDAAGNVATTTNARAQLTRFAYDELDRVRQIDRTAGEGTIKVTYDPLTRQPDTMSLYQDPGQLPPPPAPEPTTQVSTLVATLGADITEFTAGIADGEDVAGTFDAGAAGIFPIRVANRFDPAEIPGAIEKVELIVQVERTVSASAQSWRIGPYGSGGQGNPETDGLPLAFERLDLSANPYQTTTALRTTGVKTIDLGAQAIADLEAARAAGTTFTLGIQQLDESTSSERRADLSEFIHPSHPPKLRVTSVITPPAPEPPAPDPSGSLVYRQSFEYDDLGRVSRLVLDTPGFGNRRLVLDRTYDLLGRAKRIVYPDVDNAIEYVYAGAYLKQICRIAGNTSCSSAGASPILSDIRYDALGRESQIFSPGGDLQKTYDPTTYRLKRMVVQTPRAQVANALNLSFSYDPAGNIRSISDTNGYLGHTEPDASATYTYDARNRLRSVTRSGQQRFFGYDRIGNLVANEVTSAFNIATPGATQNQLYSDPARPHAVTRAADGRTYKYDASGNVIQRGNQHLRFDSDNRLTCVGSASSPCSTAQYLYDMIGIRIAENVPGRGFKYYLGDLYEYDASSRTATAHVRLEDREVARVLVDGAVLRSGVGIGGSPIEPWLDLLVTILAAIAVITCCACLIYWGGLARMRERPALASLSLSLAILFVAPPTIWAQGTSQTSVRVRWVFSDQIGSGVLLTDATGNRTSRTVFGPFGTEHSALETEQDLTRIFAGHPVQAETGLIYMQQRWYDPAVGRFLSVDPLVPQPTDPQSYDAYAYVRNNPINLVDPDGRSFNLLYPFVFGSVENGTRGSSAGAALGQAASKLPGLQALLGRKLASGPDFDRVNQRNDDSANAVTVGDSSATLEPASSDATAPTLSDLFPEEEVRDEILEARDEVRQKLDEANRRQTPGGGQQIDPESVRRGLALGSTVRRVRDFILGLRIGRESIKRSRPNTQVFPGGNDVGFQPGPIQSGGLSSGETTPINRPGTTLAAVVGFPSLSQTATDVLNSADGKQLAQIADFRNVPVVAFSRGDPSTLIVKFPNQPAVLVPLNR